MSGDDPTWGDHLQSTTRSIPDIHRRLGEAGIPCLTVLCHPDFQRVGERAVLPGLLSREEEELSRLGPYFAPVEGGPPRPLADPHVSRRPIRISAPSDSVLRIDPGGRGVDLEVDGVGCTEPLEIDRAVLSSGIVLVLKQRIALLLHAVSPRAAGRPPSYGLVGESDAVVQLRHDIGRLAHLDYPVLLRGESGTGKELVARALHDAGPRAKKPCVCVNIAAMPASLAVAELFGAVKGAFTGADRPRPGHFQQAGGGTLFLDELGDAPADVQVMLLRALETGRVQPLGASKSVAVDIRLVAATDVDLEAAIEHGEFRSSLFHRLSSCELELPPLRERREDIGRLFFHFFHQEMAAVKEAMSKAEAPTSIQVSAPLMARLALYPWPGNVRELRNVVRQLVVAGWGRSELFLPPNLERRLSRAIRLPADDEPEASRNPNRASAPATYRDPDEIGEAELLAALRRFRWNIQKTAKNLSIARPTLYRLMRDCPGVRKASDLGPEELQQAIQRAGGRLETMVDELEVSKRGIQLRMSELGLSLEVEAPQK